MSNWLGQGILLHPCWSQIEHYRRRRQIGSCACHRAPPTCRSVSSFLTCFVLSHKHAKSRAKTRYERSKNNRRTRKKLKIKNVKSKIVPAVERSSRLGLVVGAHEATSGVNHTRWSSALDEPAIRVNLLILDVLELILQTKCWVTWRKIKIWSWGASIPLPPAC